MECDNTIKALVCLTEKLQKDIAKLKRINKELNALIKKLGGENVKTI